MLGLGVHPLVSRLLSRALLQGLGSIRLRIHVSDYARIDIRTDSFGSCRASAK